MKIKKSTRKKVKKVAKRVKRTVNRYATKIGLRRRNPDPRDRIILTNGDDKFSTIIDVNNIRYIDSWDESLPKEIRAEIDEAMDKAGWNVATLHLAKPSSVLSNKTIEYLKKQGINMNFYINVR